jgi:serine phosphatase RsbU (regulator of sigma subunit)/anti-sigma regulatory factor (Ser/Thr protein kinase)
MADPAANAAQCVTFRYPLPCDLSQVRAARLAVRAFLEEQRLHEEEISACELGLAEACNNAVQYSVGPKCLEPIEILVICTPWKIEIHVNDHTEGFDWPEEVKLPDLENESGRGIFFIQSLMDGANYFRGHGENSLVMRKMRYHQAQKQRTPPPVPLAPRESEDQRSPIQSRQAVQDMARELCFRSESLAAIFRCSAEFGRTDDLKGFARRLLGDLLHITDGDWFVLRLLTEGEVDLRVFAASDPGEGLEPIPLQNAGEPLPLEAQAARTRKTILFGRARPLGELDPLNLYGPDSCGLALPFGSGNNLIGTLTVGRCGDAEMFLPAQMDVVRLFADFVSIQIVNARLREEHVNSRVVSHELELARNIQRSLLPKAIPAMKPFGVAGHCETARQVGGDFYDVLQISESAYLLFVADVMGKGVPAALFASILQRLVRVIPEWIHRPAEMFSRINHTLFEELSSVGMFITAQLAHVDLKNRSVTVASAGQGPVLIAGSNTPTERLVSEGLPLGILRTTTFESVTRPLGDNARLLLYTDGLTELKNSSGEQLGIERLQKWLSNSTGQPATAEQLKAQLLAEVQAFGSESPLQDDQTFLIFAEENLGELNEANPASFCIH